MAQVRASHGRRSLVGCSPWGREESDTTERRHFHFSLSCIGEGNGSPRQCSCLENPRDGGAWWAAVYGVARSDMTDATQQQQGVCPALIQSVRNKEVRSRGPCVQMKEGLFPEKGEVGACCYGTLYHRASQVALLVKTRLPVQEARGTWVRSPGREDPLEEGMATHSSVLAWRIPGTGEPGGLPSMGSRRVGHD